MYEDLKGKATFITGAGKRTGLGYAIADKLGASGANVVVADLCAGSGVMGFEVLVARRHLKSMRNRAQVSLTTLIAVSGVTLGVAALVIGVWVYMLVLHLGQDQNGISQQMVQLHSYMKNMAAGEPVENGDSYMSSMAHDIHRMSIDSAAALVEIQQVSSDIGVMRTAMTDMRGDIGSMNSSTNDMRGDMKHMRENISGMAQSLSNMSRNVRRLSHDAQNLREPFRGMMPW